MTTEEIAEQIIGDSEQMGLAQAVEKWRPDITREVQSVIASQALDLLDKNPQRAFSLSVIVEAVAQIVGTEEAQVSAAQVKGCVHGVRRESLEAIKCFQIGEAYYLACENYFRAAGAQVNQVSALRNLADYPAALAMAERARASCLLAGEQADEWLGNLEVILAWIYEQMGDPEEALACHGRAKILYTKKNLPLRIAGADNDIAYILMSMDRLEEAEALLQATHKTVLEANYLLLVGTVELNLAWVAYKQGQYQQALRYQESCLQYRSEPAEIAHVHLDRSVVYRHLNLVEEMMHLSEQAGRVFQKYGMRREYVRCLVNLAIGYQRLNLLPEAEKLMARARRLLFQQKAWGVLLTLDGERAELALAAGRLATARRLARRVENQLATERQPGLAAQIQLVMARCALAQQPPDLLEARRRAEQALVVAEQYHLPIRQVHAYHLLGRGLEAAGREEEAWSHYQRAIETNERLRALLRHDEFETGYMEDKVPVYGDHVRLTHRRMATGAVNHAHLLHSLALAQSAPLLHLTEGAHVGAGEAASNPAEQARLNELRQQWHRLQSKLDAPDNADKVRAGDTVQWRDQLRHIEREMSELMRQNRKAAGGDETSNGNGKEPAALLAAIQKRLNPEDVLLHYYAVQNHLHALLVTNGETYLIPNLVTTTALERLLHTWRFYLYHLSAFAQATEAADQAARLYLARLYQMLIAPLEPYLHTANRLYLIFPPEWHDVPMPALFDGKRYLIERFQLIYLSTAKAMPNVKQTFSFQGESTAIEGRQSLIVGVSNGDHLPAAVEEARLIASTLPTNVQITSLLEEQATLDQIRNLAPTNHLLHLATHALFRLDNPLFSSIQLADGRITVADLYEMTLMGRPFVVLSACETGRGRPRGGGLLGMARGFLAAGASGLIVTLWPVSDRASVELMAGYYRTWLSSSSSGDAALALQRSQQEAIARGHSPLHWAGFILIGG